MEIPKELSPLIKKALSRLALGDLTEGEMLLYLTDPRRKACGFSEELAADAVELLVREGFLDDVRVLRLVLKKTADRSFGPRRVREELVRRRFTKRHIDAALRRPVDYKARATRKIVSDASFTKLLDTPATRKKLADRLVRLGYDYTTAFDAIAAAQREDFSFGKD